MWGVGWGVVGGEEGRELERVLGALLGHCCGLLQGVCVNGSVGDRARVSTAPSAQQQQQQSGVNSSRATTSAAAQKQQQQQSSVNSSRGVSGSGSGRVNGVVSPLRVPLVQDAATLHALVGLASSFATLFRRCAHLSD